MFLFLAGASPGVPGVAGVPGVHGVAGVVGTLLLPGVAGVVGAAGEAAVGVMGLVGAAEGAAAASGDACGFAFASLPATLLLSLLPVASEAFPDDVGLAVFGAAPRADLLPALPPRAVDDPSLLGIRTKRAQWTEGHEGQGRLVGTPALKRPKCYSLPEFSLRRLRETAAAGVGAQEAFEKTSEALGIGTHLENLSSLCLVRPVARSAHPSREARGPRKF